MADVVVRATQPALAAIKLAWWRERLKELDQGKTPAEPRLKAAAVELLPRGIKGVELAEIEAGWATLLEEQPNSELAFDRGATLFAIAARLLEADHWQGLRALGHAYASASLTRHGIRMTPGDRAEFLPRSPRRLRPLTGLAALAMRDLKRGAGRIEPEGTPGRAWTLLRHRLTGKL